MGGLKIHEHLSISCEKLHLRDLQFEVKTQVLSVGPWLWAAVRLAWAFVVWQASCDQEAVVEISMWLGRDWFRRVGTKMLMKKKEDDEDSDESSSAQPLAEE